MRAPRVAVVFVATAAAVLALATPAQAAASSSRPARVRVPNIQPALTGARELGAAPAAQTVGVRLYLAGRNPAGLAAAVKAVSTPGSASYGHYLTPAQVRDRYAADAATVSAVRSFLTGYGLKVTAVPGNRTYVDAQGTVAQVQKAFAAPLRQYAKNGATIRATTAAVTVPSALAGKVTAVSGLSSRSARITPSHVDGPRVSSRAHTGRTAAGTARTGRGAPPPDAFVNAPPCSTYWAQKVATTLPTAFGTHQPYAPCGYTPSQLKGAYGLGSSVAHGFGGRGQTVAITDAYAAPTILADADTYAVKHGGQPFRKGQFTQVLPSFFRYGYDDTGDNNDVCGEQGWYGEETLDVEAVHAVAPAAKVTYVASSSCTDDDFLTALNTVVDRRLANIVTNSWGTDLEQETVDYTDAYQQVFYFGALEGIGFYFSSGDNGDAASENNGVPTAGSPANSTLVTAVGGTSLAVGKKNQRLWETGWSTGKSTLTSTGWDPAPPGNYLYGAGGGTSEIFDQPWYQKGVVPASLATRASGGRGRVVPDVAAVGDPSTGFLVGETQTFPDGTVKYSEYRIGGTSLASPVFAGIMAIADQISGRPHGFANPALYALHGTKAFYDPTPRTGTGVVRVDYVNGVDAGKGTTTSLRSIDTTVGTTLRVRRGYDDITGVGTPNGGWFLGSLGIVR
jgi:subtilase family serine protease